MFGTIREMLLMLSLFSHCHRVYEEISEFYLRSIFNESLHFSLHLENNPWQCDCRLEKFWTWVMARYVIQNH